MRTTRAKPSSRTDSTLPVPSTWPWTMWPPSRSPARSGSSRLTLSPCGERPERAAAQRLGHHVGAEGLAVDLDGGQADAVDGHRVARRELARERGVDAQAHAVAVALERAHGARSATSPVNTQAPLGTRRVRPAEDRRAHHSRSRAVISTSSSIRSTVVALARTASAIVSTPWPSIARARLRAPGQDRGDEDARLVDLAGLEERARQVRPALEQQRLDVARAELVERVLDARGLVGAAGDDHLDAGRLERLRSRCARRRASRRRSPAPRRRCCTSLLAERQAGLGVEHDPARLARDALDARGQQRVVGRARCRCRPRPRPTRRASGGRGRGWPRRRSTASRRCGWRPCRRASSRT